MSIRIVVRRSPSLHGKPRPPARLANLIAAPAIAMAPLLAIALTAAQAADLPVKAPAAAAYNWGGCYVGLNAGGGASGSSFTTTVGNAANPHMPTPADAATVGAIGTGSANDSNFLGGGQAGCNWQSGTLVFGLEGDVDYFHSNPMFVDPNGTLTTGDTFTATQSLRTDFLATVRPRLGVAADRNLAYLTGGAAFTKATYTQTYSDTIPGTGSASGSKSLIGWVAGAGWEHAWTDHWTFRLEYLFAKFPTTNGLGSIVDTAGGANPLQGSADLVIQTVRAGVNYKF